MNNQDETIKKAVSLHEKLERIAPSTEPLNLIELARRIYHSTEFSEEEKTVILAGGLAYMSEPVPTNTTDFFEG